MCSGTICFLGIPLDAHSLKGYANLVKAPLKYHTTTGLINALENGTEEVSHLLRNSCNLLLECRCCKSIFRHAKYFHKHKMSVCRAYHRPIAPSYEEVLAFQKQVAALWDADQPSTSKQVYEHKERSPAFQVIGNEPYFIDSYDGIEELCGESRTDSPEPGEFLEEPSTPVFTNERLGDDDEIEEGEYIERLSTDNCPSSQSLIKVPDEGSDVDQIDSSNTGESDTISLTESPVHNGQLHFPIFNDQLLESPTHTDYFGKGDKITINPALSTIQME
ncbi:unnamed protein product [Angiostrongylus costaricensis]|uniref:C2H2-type domain-containing protein n=1 Tax=Angiostrongylus costaricensis TaxID=334426 RepID=A0A0R3PKC1_ANGCS|nr:unnamed protein product [Angiostrongylus costaricensis]